MYVAIEGMDYSRKTTVVSLLAGMFNGDATIVREVGGTAFGETIRKMVFEDQTDATRLTSTEEMMLILSQRSYLQRRVIKPAMIDNRIVVSDRGDASTFVYQVDEKNEASYLALHKDLGLIVPDMFFYLDVDYDTYLHRQRQRGSDHAYHDVIDENLFAYRRRRYHEYINRFVPNAHAVFDAKEKRESPDMANIIFKTIRAVADQRKQK